MRYMTELRAAPFLFVFFFLQPWKDELNYKTCLLNTEELADVLDRLPKFFIVLVFSSLGF